MDQLTRYFYRLLITLACVSMVATFVIVMLGILARQVTFINTQGLDAYAGYAIAATLFFALPTALMHGDHIRVTLLLDRMGSRTRAAFEWAMLIAGLGLADPRGALVTRVYAGSGAAAAGRGTTTSAPRAFRLRQRSEQ